MHGARRPFRQYLLLLGLIPLLGRILLLDDEEGEDDGLLGSYGAKPQKPLPAELLPAEADYVDGIRRTTAMYSQSASRRMRRFYGMTMIAIASSAGVPVVVASNGPSSVVALLGAVAVVAQGAQQLLQDQRNAVEHHATAARLSRLLRQFGLDFAMVIPSQQRHAFAQFHTAVESALEASSPALIAAMRPSGGPSS